MKKHLQNMIDQQFPQSAFSQIFPLFAKTGQDNMQHREYWQNIYILPHSNTLLIFFLLSRVVPASFQLLLLVDYKHA